MIKNEDGYTLPELIVVISLTAFLATVVFGFSIAYWAYGYKLEARLDVLTTRLNVSDFIRESVGTATGLINQNSLPDAHPMSADPAYSPSNFWTLIHAIPGNKVVGSAGTYTPLIYYRRPSFSTTNTYIMNGTQPFEDEYVLYLDGSKKALMLRTIANSNATNNRLQTSCPTGYVTTSCPADKTLSTDVTSVDLRYFSRTGLTIDYTSIYDSNTNSYIGPDFASVEVVELKLNLSRKAKLQNGNTENSSTIIRIALRNA
jgi:prepilin-type N-terminal cleavage/methylation domain-containing protein